MKKKERIEKIKETLTHLTSDELKDVQFLASSQFEVRKKIAEKEYFERELNSLKSQLAKPAVPVLPADIADMVKHAWITKKSLRWFFTVDAQSDFPKQIEWYGGDVEGEVTEEIGKRQLMIAEALMHGFDIEKPKHFCLKHIDMSKKDANGNWYLAHEFTEVRHYWELGDKVPTDKKYQFTPEEIKGMKAGSYEIIEMSNEDGGKN